MTSKVVAPIKNSTISKVWVALIAASLIFWAAWLAFSVLVAICLAGPFLGIWSNPWSTGSVNICYEIRNKLKSARFIDNHESRKPIFASTILNNFSHSQ